MARLLESVLVCEVDEADVGAGGAEAVRRTVAGPVRVPWRCALGGNAEEDKPSVIR